MVDAIGVGSSTSTPSSPVNRRAVTMPLRPSTSLASLRNASASVQETGGLEIFYVHPSVRIVKFEPAPMTTNGATTYERRHKRADSTDEQGTLPYSSPFEQTMAVGPLRMYRTMQGFAMMSCGSGKCIRPIMPKSKSWCVDDVSSKFVFAIGRTPQGRPQFWRMELPLDFPDHKAKADELRGVLAQISQFEKAACPFVRNFHVELPEPPEVPTKKKPWKPVERPRTAPHDSGPATPGALIDEPSRQRRSSTQHESTYFTPPALKTFGPSSTSNSGDASFDSTMTPRGYRRSSLSRPEVLETARSVTAPHLSSGTLQSSSLMHRTPLGPAIREEPQESQAVEATFDSRSTWEPPFTPPPRTAAPVMRHYPKENIMLSKRADRQKLPDRSEVEIGSGAESPRASPKTPRVWQMLDGQDEDSADSAETRPSSPPAPRTPSPVRRPSDEEEYFDAWQSPSVHRESPSTPTRTRKRASRTNSESCMTAPCTPQRVQERTDCRKSTSSTERARNPRALSPLPSAAVLFTPTKARALQTARHLPTAIVQKTWEILMSPPSHLVEMILQLAARVTQRLRNGQRWDGENETDCEDNIEEEDEEDDYGMPLKFVRTNSSTNIKSKLVLDELVKVRSRERWAMPGSYGSDLD